MTARMTYPIMGWPCLWFQVEYEWDPRPYENMINNATLCSLFEANAKTLNIEFTDMSGRVIPTGSTDMGNVSHVVPSIHPMFDIGTTAANHTRDFTTAAGNHWELAETLRSFSDRFEIWQSELLPTA